LGGADGVILESVIIESLESQLGSDGDFSGDVLKSEFLIPCGFLTCTSLDAGPESLATVAELDVWVLLTPDLTVLVEIGT
jgi:hypothetical protein